MYNTHIECIRSAEHNGYCDWLSVFTEPHSELLVDSSCLQSELRVHILLKR